MELEPDWQLFENQSEDVPSQQENLSSFSKDYDNQGIFNRSINFVQQSNYIPSPLELQNQCCGKMDDVLSYLQEFPFEVQEMQFQNEFPFENRDDSSQKQDEGRQINLLNAQGNECIPFNSFSTSFKEISDTSSQKGNSSRSTNKQVLKEVNYQIMPILKNLRPREIYFIYGEVLIELDAFTETNILERSAGYNHFKRIVNILTRKDNKYMEIEFETFAEQLKEFNFIADRFRSMQNKEAEQIARIIEEYSKIVNTQLTSEIELKKQYSTELLKQRSVFCKRKGEELVSQLDENAMVFFSQNKIHPQTLEPSNFKNGFSQRLIWVFGCSPEVLTKLFFKYGQLDFTICGSKIDMQLQKILSSFTETFKEIFFNPKSNKSDDPLGENISQSILHYQLQTIDDFLIPLDAIVSRVNLSAEFDAAHNIKGVLPEIILLCDIQIDSNWMYQLVQHRCNPDVQSKDFFSSYVKTRQLQENYEDIEASKDFLTKFYPIVQKDMPKHKKPKLSEESPMIQIYKLLLSSTG